MSKLKQISICGLSIVIFTGCVVYKADSTSISTPDYNQRVNISGAHYDNVITPIGVSSIAASTIGGGYYAYQSNLLKYNSGIEQKTSTVGNAIIGAAIGFGTSYAITKLIGWGNTKKVTDKSEWIRRANDSFRLLSTNQYNSNFKAINIKVESNFQAKNLSDVKEFKSAFPKSTYSDVIVKQSIPVVSRVQLLELIDLYPNNSSLTDIKKEYIIRSTTIDELFASDDKFSNIDLNIENKASDMVASLTDAKKFVDRFKNTNSTYLTVVENKSLNFISNIEDCKIFNSIFPKSNLLNSIVDKLVNKLNRADLPALINLYPTTSSIINAKTQYVISSNSIGDFFVALDKYPIEKLRIEYQNYSEDFNSAKNIYDKLNALKGELGQSNHTRLVNSLMNECLTKTLAVVTSKVGFQNYIARLRNESWLEPEADNFVKLAVAEIDKLNKQEQDSYRANAFITAKNSGTSALLQFANKYAGTEEARLAKNELDNYVQQYVVQSIEPFMTTAKGDRGFWTTWAEGMRDVVKGAESYNIFVAGRYKNTFNDAFTVKITVELNLLKTTSLSLFSSTSAVTLTQIYYLKINAGQDKQFICLFDNVSGGTQIGSGLLSAGTSYNYASNPFTIKTEYYAENIPDNIVQQQKALIKNFTEKGNVDTKDWGGESVVADILSGDNESLLVLIVKYSSNSDYSSMSIYDSDDEKIKSKTWTSNGTNSATFYLPKGKYYIRVSGCDKILPVNLKVKQMTFIIKEDCKSSYYEESK